MGLPLHQGQRKFLRETHRLGTKINILVPANRWGKSTMVAALQIWFNFYKFGIPEGNRAAWTKAEYRTANIAPHSAMTEPVFKYVHQMLTSSFPILRPDGTMTTNQCQIEWFYLAERTLNTPPYKQFFANNSYVEHRSLGEDKGGALQGKPYGLITYDEGGRSHHLEAEVKGNLLPRLFDWGGPLYIPSTPDQNSPSILYHYDLYQQGLLRINNTYTQEGTLRDNTFFLPKQIQEQYDLYKDDPLQEQVLEGKFVFGGDSIFSAEDILAAQTDSLNDGKRWQPSHSYVIGVDTAIGSDEIVYAVLDTTEEVSELVRMVARKGNSQSPQAHLQDFLDLVEHYNKEGRVKILIETWNGESARFYQDLPPWVQSITSCYGAWQPNKNRTDNKNQIKSKTQDIKKADIIQALNKLLSARQIKIPRKNVDLERQLYIFKEKDSKIPTDRVIALSLAAWMAQEEQSKQGSPTFISM